MSGRGRLRRHLDELRLILTGRWRPVPWLILAMTAAAILDLAGVALVAPLIHGLVESGAGDRAAFWVPAGAVLAVLALRAWVAYRLSRARIAYSDGLRGHLMARLLGGYLQQPWDFHLRQSRSTLRNRLVYETSQVASHAVDATLRAVADLLVLLALSALLAWLQPVATGLIWVVVLLAGWLAHATVHRQAVGNSEKMVRQHDLLLRSIDNALASAKQARILGRFGFFADSLARVSHAHAETSARQAALQTIPRSTLEIALVGCVLAIGIFAAGASTSPATWAATAATFAAAALRMLPAASSLAAQLTRLRAARPVQRRLAADLVNNRAAAVSVPQPIVFGSVRLKHVGLCYPNSTRAALQDINLELRAGSYLGISGPSGAGKSTLADVLLGLLSPSQGQVLIDGQPLTGREANWAASCAYLSQDQALFDDSLRANVALSEERNADVDARVEEALRAVALGPWFDELPQRLEQPLGPGGLHLSGGQRQRVALARALFHRRGLLVLDEPCAALDRETMGQVVETLRELRGRVTVVLLSHEPELLALCDDQVMLRGGRQVPAPPSVVRLRT